MKTKKQTTTTTIARKRTTDSTSRNASLDHVALQHGFRSGLEEQIANELHKAGQHFGFETLTLGYTIPASAHRYTPDFELPNGILIETKGRFVTEDRKKHLFLKKQHPDLDIRFVFSNANGRISKTSRTTYADWCNKHGFLHAHRHIPTQWLTEPRCNKRLTALERAKVSPNRTSTK